LNYNYQWMQFSWIQLILYVPIILFYCLLPDIDIQTSKPRFIITVTSLILIIYFAVYNKMLYIIFIAVLLLIIWIIRFLPGWGHRGHAHSLIFIVIFSLPIFYLSWQVGILCLITSFSHLLFDRCIKIW